jgi:Fe-S cluster assembly protein SufD
MNKTATVTHETTEAFNEQAFDARNTTGPDWLRKWRSAAWLAWDSLPLPTTKLEEWRYTDPSKLKYDRVGLASLAETATVPQAEVDWLATRAATVRVMVVGTKIVSIEMDEALKEKGVVVMDLERAAEEYEGVVREQLGRAVESGSAKFAALNGAFWSAGLFIHVPKGVRIDEPIRILRHLPTPGLAYFPRTLIVADEGSHAGVVEEFDSPDFAEPTFSCGVVEVIAGAAANVQYVALQRYGANVHHISTQRTIAGRDADLDSLIVNMGGAVARVDLAASLEGAGSRSDMLGLYFGRGQQHFDHSTRQDHTIPHATSDLLYKGALADDSRADLPRHHQGVQERAADGRVPDQPQPDPVEDRRGRGVAEPRDRGRRRALLPRRHRRPARCGGTVLHHEPRHRTA